MSFYTETELELRESNLSIPLQGPILN